MELGFIKEIIVYTFEIIKGDEALFLVIFPILFVIDVPIFLTVISGIVVNYFRSKRRGHITRTPSISAGITCYSEGNDIKKTVITLCEQVYAGKIEIIVVVDGAKQNYATYQAAIEVKKLEKKYHNRKIIVLPKWQRGGRVSSLNAALNIASGELFLALDGDTSFNNNMIYEIAREFEDHNVPAVAGSLKVRNRNASFVAKMQSIEYMISIEGGKTGLAEWNLINNVSGAFGAFRTQFIKQIGGWDTHSAEDLDLTMRIQQYMNRKPSLRIPFANKAIGLTDAPTTWADIIKQRIRWDGDLIFIYFRKHRLAFTPKLLGWKRYVFTLVYGVLQNILMPLLVVIFNAWIIFLSGFVFFTGMLAVQYIIYSVLIYIQFIFYLCAISDKPKEESKVLLLIPIYPAYALFIKLVSVFAILNELFRRSHEESGMAPWWVLKRGKKF